MKKPDSHNKPAKSSKTVSVSPKKDSTTVSKSSSSNIKNLTPSKSANIKKPNLKSETKPAKAVPAKDVKSKPAVPLKAEKSKPVKEPKAAKTVQPKKLVQVVPAHKPSVSHNLPQKREKMLMRFGKPTKRVMFSIDFLLKASPTIVYHFITTPSALVRWFCDGVDITGEYYTYAWNGNTEVAELIDDIEDERLRFTWLDGEDEDEFFEFRIAVAGITEETILYITDFAWEDEVAEQKEWWRTKIDLLRKETGDA